MNTVSERTAHVQSQPTSYEEWSHARDRDNAQVLARGRRARQLAREDEQDEPLEFHPAPEDEQWWAQQTRTAAELDAIEQCEFDAWVAALDSDRAFQRALGADDWEAVYNQNG